MHWTVPQTMKNVHITGGTPLPHTARAAGPTRRQAVLAAAAVACWPLALRAGEDARAPLRFGILPIGGMVDSRTGWEPLLDELMQALGRPIHMFSATSYEGLGEAVRRGEVDLAFLSGKMALDAVTQHDMRAIAQVTRHDGLPGYRALLLAREGGPVRDLEAVLVEPGRWRLARGEDGTEKPLSCSTGQLKRIAETRPPSREAMARIIDDARLDRFAAAFLSEIQTG